MALYNLHGQPLITPPARVANRDQWADVITGSAFWFTRSAMAWFGTRVVWSSLTQDATGWLFITSEQDGRGAWNGERRYSVRHFRYGSGVDTMGEFGGYDTLKNARIAIKGHLALQRISATNNL